MLKRQAFRFIFVVMAIAAQACAPSATQGPEAFDAVSDAQKTLVAATAGSIDPVTGAKQTLAAATQQSLTAVAIAQQTIAAANPLNSSMPVSIPLTGLGLPNDPNIEANFTGQVVCSQFEINLTNRSATTFKSMFISISVKDGPSSLTVTSSTNGFLGHDSSQSNTNDNCEASTFSPNLAAGTAYTVVFPKFAEKEGSTLEGNITLCTENDFSGQCSKASIVFAPIAENTPSPASLLSTSSPTAQNIAAPVTPLSPDIFDAKFANVVSPCAGTWWVRVSLTNNSINILKSMSISVKDTVTDEIAPNPDNPNVFTDKDPTVCDPINHLSNPKGIPDLGPNISFPVSSGNLSKDPTQHLMEVTLKLCTEEGLQGQCSEKTISFTPSIVAQATGDSTAYIILSAGTNCRTGPGTEYEIIGGYEANKKILVLGKDPAGKYWVVASPYRNDAYPKCWLDGRFVKESGNLSSVQISTVPPTPTPRPPTLTPTPTATSTATLTPTP
jgi:hypothetical protein